MGAILTGNVYREGDTPPAPTVAELLAYAADKRWRVEIGGLVLPSSAAIATDRETQSKLTAACIKASADSGYVVANWKLGPGIFTALDAGTIIAIGDAVASHVQAAFDAEAAVSAGVLADPPTITTFAEIETAGWPSNSG